MLPLSPRYFATLITPILGRYAMLRGGSASAAPFDAYDY